MSRSGLLNKRVGLWKKTTVRNDYGELVSTWTKNKDLKSYTLRKTGKQIISQDEVFDLMKIRIQVRNQHDIGEHDRIKYGDYFYDIEFLQPIDVQERWLMIYGKRLND